MQAQNFMRVEEVAQELGISKSHAYKAVSYTHLNTLHKILPVHAAAHKR